ncbi:15439_t:CDS:1, partial [Entrophospora sp. SA101]
SITNQYPALNNTIYQNSEDIYHNGDDNNYAHQQNMIRNYLIHQNQNHEEIYHNNNYVRQNMVHNTIYQNPEDIYQNV